jgi:hypothetical protein
MEPPEVRFCSTRMRATFVRGLLLVGLVTTSCEAGPVPPATVDPQLGGFRNGRCVETTIADASGVITVNSAFGRIGSGPINGSSEYLIAVVRGAPLGDDRGFHAERLDGYGKISVPARAEPRANPWGDVVWRVPLFKPAGGGCWKVRPEGASDADGIVVRIDLL